MNYLRPDLKKEPISDREAETIISLQKLLGNRWSVIAAKMPGRTDNEIKNYWNSRVRKRQTAAAASGADSANSEPAAKGEKEPMGANAATVTTASPPPTVPARLPAVFACQLLDGVSKTAATPSPTAGSESEVSGREDSRDFSYSGAGADDDGDMVRHLLALDDLDYPADFLFDVPGLLDAWDCELYRANSSSSMII
ncbi:hypothetical protein GUJ93_ZPchr0001g30421 [Zizania palustris]|uniref:Uncharacterized protein n=1 Tax=Zizania palustris TaxID=103762 RepID=A0A8J5V7W1_ZIZPA|nr:hypothetical protein GUJ93_ZPchr0001g30421 [Zizania palustris]